MKTPSLARRTGAIAPFHVMELVKHAMSLQARGRSIIHLSIGEPDFTAAPAVLRALNEAGASGRTQYTEAFGIPELRQAISKDYRDKWGVDVSPDRILVTAGASGALTLACCALVNPGDGVLLADPGYPCNRHFVAAFDGEPQLIATDATSRFQLTAAAVAQAWQPNTRGVVISSPANPTGTSISRTEMGAVLNAVRERGGFSIVDEIYLGLTYDGDAASALVHGDDMIISNSFSKYTHMTGWRLGWLVVPQAWCPAFEKLAQNLFICASSLAQRAALGCFEPESQALYAERRDEFRRRRDYIVPALRQLGFGVEAEPDGAFYVYANVSAFSNDSTQFAYDALDATGVAIVPGKDFGSHRANEFVRISYASSMANLQEAIARLEAWLPRRQSVSR